MPNIFEYILEVLDKELEKSNPSKEELEKVLSILQSISSNIYLQCINEAALLSNSKEGTPEHNRLQFYLDMIKKYEELCFPLIQVEAVN